jgi:hypothetical protein
VRKSEKDMIETKTMVSILEFSRNSAFYYLKPKDYFVYVRVFKFDHHHPQAQPLYLPRFWFLLYAHRH